MRARTGDVPPGAAALGVALLVATAYAAFASGAIGVTDQARFQVIVAAIAFGTLAGLLFGRGLRFEPSRGAMLGVGLLVGFAAWCALSITWSIAPDQSWLEANRALSYGLVAALGIALGSSLPRAVERVALAYLAIATAVALFALGGKLFPWFEIPGVIDLNHTERFSRLRAPLDYWNALALVCVMAVPIAARAGADLGGRMRGRVLAIVALVPLLTTIALTYSRGGLIVLAVALALLIGVGPDRLRLAAAVGAGLVGAVPPILVTFLSDDLTTDGLKVADRTGEGLLFLAATVAGLALTLVLARRLVRAGDRVVLSAAGARRARTRGDRGGDRRAAGRDSRAGAVGPRPDRHDLALRRRVHRGQVRPPERPGARAAQQLRQPLGLVGGGGERLRRPAGDRPRRRLLRAHPPALPPGPAPGPQRAQRAARVPLRGRVDRRPAGPGRAGPARRGGGSSHARARAGPRARVRDRAAGGAAGAVGAPVGGLGLGDPGGDGVRAGLPRRAGRTPALRRARRSPRLPGRDAWRRWPPAPPCSRRWWRWRRCPRCHRT